MNVAAYRHWSVNRLDVRLLNQNVLRKVAQISDFALFDELTPL